MALGMGLPKTKSFTVLRSESRIPMEIGVHISGHAVLPGTEATFTENVSSRGARVLSTRRWKINDQLVLSTLAGTFRSVARVAYCQMVPQAGFAGGLEFVETTASWIVAD